MRHQLLGMMMKIVTAETTKMIVARVVESYCPCRIGHRHVGVGRRGDWWWDGVGGIVVGRNYWMGMVVEFVVVVVVELVVVVVAMVVVVVVVFAIVVVVVADSVACGV